MAVRLDYEASRKRLHELGWPDSEPAPPIPQRKPRYDDDETIGVSFFRTRVVGDLSDADLRASLFERVSFAGTDLRFADLRRSTFTNCVFDRASMKGTILTRRLGKTLSLSGSQLSEINWTDDDGEEPVGG